MTEFEMMRRGEDRGGQHDESGVDRRHEVHETDRWTGLAVPGLLGVVGSRDRPSTRTHSVGRDARGDDGRPLAALRRHAATSSLPANAAVAGTAGDSAADTVIRRKTPKLKKVSKPKGKNKVLPAKLKEELEDLVGKADNKFTDVARDAYRDYPDQYVDLLAYKLSKHRNNDVKRNIWYSSSPRPAVEEALVRTDALGQSDDAGKLQLVDEAASRKDFVALGAYLRSAPDVVEQVAADKLVNGKTLDDKGLEFWGRLLDDAALVRVAQRTTAEAFITEVLDKLRGSLQMVEFMRMHALMEFLEENGGATFIQLRDTTPMLSVVAKGRKAAQHDRNAKTAARKGKPVPPPRPLDIVDHVFDAFVRNEGIDLTYFTNSLTPTASILTGGMSPIDKAMVDAQKDVMNKERPGSAPIKPATQCHNLLKTLEHVMAAIPDLHLTIESEDVKGVTLTKSLASLPRGLIDRSYAGNVFDADGNATGQVCFTGDDGRQSHTWSVINGKPYDPVMGTKGAGVKAAVDGEFEQVKPGEYKEKGGRRYLVLDKTLPISPNRHGFKSSYRLVEPPPRRSRDAVSGVVVAQDAGPRQS